MRAGKLRHRVELQQKVIADNALGGANPTWAAIDCFKRVPAAVIPLSGGESEFADRMQATLMYRIEVRFLRGIDPNAQLRVVWGERTLNVTAIIDVGGRGREHHLMCTEVNDG